jgi:hypothetical protein
MCNYKTWFYEEKKGYIIECDKCGKVQVGFGNVLLSFLKEEFDTFRQHILNAYNRKYPVIDAGIKHIFIPTSCKGLTVLLNTQELEDFHHMLEYADNEMKAQELIGLFYKKEIE